MKEKFIDNFLDLSFQDMRYRLFIPSVNCDTLILHLHGSGGRGNNNVKNLNYMDQAGHHTIINENLAYILAPQVTENNKFFDITWDQCIYDQDKIKFDSYIKSTYKLLKDTKGN